MNAEDFGDLVADGEHRVQRSHRLLEDHGNLPAPDPTHAIMGRLDQILPVQQNPAAGNAGRRFRDQAQYG